MDLITGEYVFGGDEYVAGRRAAAGDARRRLGVPGRARPDRAAGARVHDPGRGRDDHPGAVERADLGGNAPDFDFGVSPGPAPDEASLDNPVWVGQLPNSANMMWLNTAAKNPGYVGGYFRWLGSHRRPGRLCQRRHLAPTRRCSPRRSSKAKLSPRAVAMLQMAEDQVRIHPNPFVRNPAAVQGGGGLCRSDAEPGAGDPGPVRRPAHRREGDAARRGGCPQQGAGRRP